MLRLSSMLNVKHGPPSVKNMLNWSQSNVSPIHAQLLKMLLLGNDILLIYSKIVASVLLLSSLDANVSRNFTLQSWRAAFKRFFLKENDPIEWITFNSVLYFDCKMSVTLQEEHLRMNSANHFYIFQWNRSSWMHQRLFAPVDRE